MLKKILIILLFVSWSGYVIAGDILLMYSQANPLKIIVKGKTQNEEAGAIKKVNDSDPGALTEIEAGLELTQGSFTVTPKVIISSADNKVFNEEEESTGTDSSTVVGLTIGYSL